MLRPFFLLLLSLTCAFAQDVRITEFLPHNTSGIQDEDGTFQPWIELWNPNTTTVTLTNWRLSHSGSQWTFPPGFQIPPGEFMLIFASGKNRAIVTNRAHTNFTLNPAGGGPLQLLNASSSVVSTFATYPALGPNVSYGRDLFDNTQIGSYSSPTPEEENNYTGSGVSGHVVLSQASRSFQGSLSVSLTQETPADGAVIRYTLNGTPPISTSAIYSGNALTISTTSQLRARVFTPGKLPGEIETAGYLLTDASTTNFNTAAPIIVVSNFGLGTFPDTGDQSSFMWVWEPGPDGRARLSNTPTLATRSAVDRRGSSTIGNPKTNFNLEARKGRDDFDHDVELLGMPEGSDWVFHAPYSFDRSLLHNPFIYALSNIIGQTAMRNRMAEVFVETTGGALTFSGGGSGDYYGVYNVMEKIRRNNDRVEISKLSTYDNDAVGKTGGYIFKVDRRDSGDSGFSVSGPGGQGAQTLAYYYPKEVELRTTQRDPQEQYLTSHLNSFLAALYGANYKDPVAGYAAFLDVPAAIDHHLLNVWAFNVDALRLSGYIYKDRGGKLVYGPIWDFDRALSSTDGRDSNPNTWRSQTGDLGTDFFNYPWWNRLFNDEDFYQKYIDRWVDLRRDAFAPESVNALLDTLNSELTTEGVSRDLSRWNQTKRAWLSPFTGINHPASQAAEIQRIKDWLQQRANFMDSQWVKPVTLNHTGGSVAPGFEVTMTAAAGSTIYYTLDGTDPRPSGGLAPTAPNVLTYTGPIVVNSVTRIKARAYNPSWVAQTGPNNPPLVSKWSGIQDARYTTDPAASTATLAVTELNYHPADPTAAELAVDPTFDTSDFEFIEVKNVGTTTIDLGGVELSGGARFLFNNDLAITMDPGEFVILSANPAAFIARYGNVATVLGPISGDLSNAGEQLIFKGVDGSAIATFTYDDAWHPLSDGPGRTLETLSSPTSNYNLASSWRASLRDGGTPGFDYELLIGEQPTGIVVNPGQSINLEVEATGDPAPTYQWRKNGNPIEGATGPTFSIASATEGDQGNYDVVLTNIGGNLASNVAVVVVNDPVGIVNHPTPQMVNPGAIAVFSVDVSGADPFTFQWRKGGVPIEGETGQDLAIVGTQDAEGSYDVVVTNPVDSKTSNAATLTVNDPVVITTQPEGKTVNPGTPVTFTVAGTGTAPITFQWRKDTVPIDGATSSELNLTASEAVQGVYDVVVSNIVGPVTSNLAPLNVNDPVQISESPVDKTVNPNAPVAFSVAAIGTGPFTYQWRKDAQPITGAQSATLEIASAAEGDQGSYDVVVGNGFSSATSGAAVLSVNDPVQIATHPLPQVIHPNSLVTFTVGATGTGPISYQWRKDTVAIDGATKSQLSFTATEGDQGNYDVVVTNMVNSVTSNAASLLVDDPVQITEHPDSKTLNPGSPVSFNVLATGTAPLSYQWSKDGEAIDGANAATYAIGSVTEAHQGLYEVVVSNEFSSARSIEVLLSVNDPVQITTQPQPQGVAPGGSATFSVVAVGTGDLTFQWLKDGTPLDGATSATYEIPAVAQGHEGDYSVVVTNLVGSVTSDTAALSFVDWPAVAGKYQGTLQGPDVADPDADPYPGRVTATVTKTGKVTGKLDYFGLSHAFAIKLNFNLEGSKAIVRKDNAGSVVIMLHLDSINKALEVTVNHNGATPAYETTGLAPQIPLRPKSAPAQRAGRYTLLMTPGTGAPTDLTAPGFLTLNVTKTGKATWLGKLPDRTVVKGSASLTADDNLAFYSPLYVRKFPFAGYVGGPLAVDETTALGDFAWRKPLQTKGSLFWRGGLAVLLTGDGDRYVAAPRATRVIPSENLSIQLEGPISNGTFQQTLVLSVQNKFAVTLPNPEKLKLSLNRTTGALTGSYFDANARATRKLEGVLLQGQERGGGFFAGTSAVGLWDLVPQ